MTVSNPDLPPVLQAFISDYLASLAPADFVALCASVRSPSEDRRELAATLEAARRQCYEHAEAAEAAADDLMARVTEHRRQTAETELAARQAADERRVAEARAAFDRLGQPPEDQR